jgi:hypothetical protein
MVTKRTHAHAEREQADEMETRARGRRRNEARQRNGDEQIPDHLVEDVSAVATAAVVGTAAAVIESELIPGILIGAAAMLVGKMFPRVTSGMRPVAKMIIRAGIAVSDKTREVVAETGEQFQDMVAEVRSERDQTAQERGRSRAARQGPSAEAAA